MGKTFILDTNVLLHDPRAIFNFGASDVVIPIEVIEEIDGFKHDAGERGRNARMCAQILDGLRSQGRLGDGVPLDGNGLLRVFCPPARDDGRGALPSFDRRVAVSILSAAMHCRRNGAGDDDETIIVTKNVNLRLKADALGVTAQDYDADRFPDADTYTGWHVLDCEQAVFDVLDAGNAATIPGFRGLPNEYVFVTAPDDPDSGVLGRVAHNGVDIRPLAGDYEEVAGIRPLNLEQTFALDALLDDEIKLVTLTGKAGTGKTLLAVAAGLHKVFAEDRYNRLLVFRPTMPVSKDIGFLPGDVQEKMRPWMQPVYDALELIREQDKRSPRKVLPPDILECEEISIEPLTYIRGRSIPHQYIIIDEAQNLTPLEVKTVITRVGKGTKIVLTGDPHQIDNPYVDALSNGLTFLVEKFRASPLSAHLGLLKGERSQLAETAANLL